jgi:hypothetical protein
MGFALVMRFTATSHCQLHINADRLAALHTAAHTVSSVCINRCLVPATNGTRLLPGLTTFPRPTPAGPRHTPPPRHGSQRICLSRYFFVISSYPYSHLSASRSGHFVPSVTAVQSAGCAMCGRSGGKRKTISAGNRNHTPAFTH